MISSKSSVNVATKLLSELLWTFAPMDAAVFITLINLARCKTDGENGALLSTGNSAAGTSRTFCQA